LHFGSRVAVSVRFQAAARWAFAVQSIDFSGGTMKRNVQGGFSIRSAFASALIVVLLLFCVTLTAHAQSTAILQGTITDPSGAVVPSAKIVVKNQATGVEWNSQSDNAGQYLVPALPVGKYRLTVNAPNFQTAVVTDITLDAAVTLTQNVALKVGAASQEVLITGETPVIDNSTITVGEVVDQKTTQEIPLNGRHFTDLSFLTAGTVTPPANGFLGQPIRGQGIFGLNTAGQREDTVNFMVNGINLNDMVQNQITFQPSINTVSEFKFDNSVPSAEYGRNPGAVVNIATRSGTNDIHGEAFEFFRNSDMDARNYFNPTTVPQATLKRNNFGAALGGPIKKNKAHYFLSYEGLRHRQGLPIDAPVLTPAEVTQAQTTGDAAVKALLAEIPTGNVTNAKGTFFVGSGVAPVNIDQGTADIDYEISNNDRLHGYVAIQEDLRQEPLFPTVGDTLPGWGDIRSSRRQIGTVSEDHIFGPELTNQVRLGYNRIHITFDPAQELSASTFDIDSGVNLAIGLPEINIGGAGALDFGGPEGEPQGRGDTTAVFGDTVSWLKGRHAFAFGTELRRFYNDNFSEDPTRFAFVNAAAFIADDPDAFNFLGFTANRIVSPTYDFFVQDSFKWRPNVTFQLGLRYDWYSTPSEADNRFVVFNTATDSLVQIGTNGIGQPFHTNNKNFEPRLGVVWDPFSTGRTVIRAAYGILTDEPITGIVTGLNANPPFTVPLAAASGITLLNAASNAGLTGLAPTTINPNFDNPYVQEWNLNVEEAFTNSLGLTVAYVGSEGTHLRVAQNINQLELNGAGDLVRPFPTLSASSPIRPSSAVGNIIEANSPGTSNYNALWVTLNKRFSHGLQFLASYSFSKSIDDVSQNNNTVLLQNSLDVGNNRGLSDFDARHRFVISGFYELPFHMNRLVSGWQVGLISSVQTGNPLFVVTGVTNFTGTTSTGLRPDVLAPVTTQSQVVVPGAAVQYFPGTVVCESFNGPLTGGPLPAPLTNCASTPNANLTVPCTFSATPTTPGGSNYPVIPTTCHFGDLGRNALTGPGFLDTDFSLIKNTKLTERFNLQFRAEFFDIFNQANFGNPVLNVQSGSFGLITSTRFPPGDTGSSRQLQMALKLQF
jgi:outer membrane receptor protein involved in Fe transport